MAATLRYTGKIIERTLNSAPITSAEQLTVGTKVVYLRTKTLENGKADWSTMTERVGTITKITKAGRFTITSEAGHKLPALALSGMISEQVHLLIEA